MQLPCCGKWRQQKRQAQAQRAFEHDFLRSLTAAPDDVIAVHLHKSEQNEDEAARRGQGGRTAGLCAWWAELQRLRRQEEEELGQQWKQQQLGNAAAALMQQQQALSDTQAAGQAPGAAIF